MVRLAIMTKQQIKAMVLDIIKQANYDVYKSLLPDATGDTEFAAQQLQELIEVAEKHLKNSVKK